MAGRLATKQAGPGEAPSLFPEAGRPNRTSARAPTLDELSLHKSVAELLDWMLLEPAVWTTFPAGWGKLTPAMAGILYRCGLKKGMPDILVFHLGRCLGIELKAPGRSQSAAQRSMTAKLQAAGIDVFVARSLGQVVDILRREGIPMRKTAPGGDL